MAMRIAGPGPASSSAITLAAWDIESVDPLTSEIGSATFHVAVRQVQASNAAIRIGDGHSRGKNTATAHAPAITTLEA